MFISLEIPAADRASAFLFQRLFGLVAVGYMWARSAAVAVERVGGDETEIWTDFRVHGDGWSRLLLRDVSADAPQLGRRGAYLHRDRVGRRLHARRSARMTAITCGGAIPEIADYRHTPESKTFRELINQRYPDLDIQHVHHAGNSSGVVDGAAAILWASGDYATAHGLSPRARVVATANMGDDPTLMLNAPVPAARKSRSPSPISQ